MAAGTPCRSLPEEGHVAVGERRCRRRCPPRNRRRRPRAPARRSRRRPPSRRGGPPPARPASVSSLSAGDSPLRAGRCGRSRRDRVDRRRRVAAQDGGLQAHLVQLRDRRGGVGSDRGGQPRSPRRSSPSRATDTTVSPRPSARRDGRGEGAGKCGRVGPADRHRWPSTTPVTPAPASDSMSLAGLARARPPRGSPPRSGARSRPRPPRPAPAASVFGRPRRPPRRGHGGEPLGQGAGLVERDGVGPRQALQHLAAADEDPEADARPVPTIIATGVARPIAHGHATRSTATRAQDRDPEVAVPEPPAEEGRHGEQEHHRDEDAADPVGQLLDRRLVPLGLVDQPLHAGQHRLCGDGVDPHHECAGARCASRRSPCSRAPVHRQRLPGEQRLVDRRGTAHDGAVERDRLVRADPHERARPARSRGRPACPSWSSASATTRAVGGRKPMRECIARAARPRAVASIARPVTRIDTMTGAITPCSRAANAPLPPRCTCRPPERNRLDGAHRQRGQRPDRDQRVHAGRAVAEQPDASLRRNGQPPATSTKMAEDRGPPTPPPRSRARAARPAARPARPATRAAARRSPALRGRRRRAGPPSGLGGAVADRVDRRAQFVGGRRSAVEGHEGPVGGQVDRRAQDRRLVGQRPLDPGGAGAAVHALEAARVVGDPRTPSRAGPPGPRAAVSITGPARQSGGLGAVAGAGHRARRGPRPSPRRGRTRPMPGPTSRSTARPVHPRIGGRGPLRSGRRTTAQCMPVTSSSTVAVPMAQA